MYSFLVLVLGSHTQLYSISPLASKEEEIWWRGGDDGDGATGVIISMESIKWWKDFLSP